MKGLIVPRRTRPSSVHLERERVGLGYLTNEIWYYECLAIAPPDLLLCWNPNPYKHQLDMSLDGPVKKRAIGRPARYWIGLGKDRAIKLHLSSIISHRALPSHHSGSRAICTHKTDIPVWVYLAVVAENRPKQGRNQVIKVGPVITTIRCRWAAWDRNQVMEHRGGLGDLCLATAVRL